MTLSKLRDDIEQVTKKAMSHESHRVIVDVSQLTDWLNVLNNELEMSSRDFCPVCKVDLGLCKTIWAAGTKLYCSRSCGKQDLASFDEYAEEINPTDVGIVRS